MHMEKEMADFRRCILAFAVLILVLGWAVPASAQLICSPSAAVVPTFRHEAFTELTGDVLLTCVGAPGAVPTPVGSVIPQSSVSVSLSAPVTSRILGGGASQPVTEALLLVDDPSPANQDPCLSPTNPAVACEVLGDGGQTFNKPGKFNVFQGIPGGPGLNSITFLGVPADPSAQGTRTYRITNIRIDATSVATGSFGLSSVYAFISTTPGIYIDNPQVLVGLAVLGLNTQTSVLNPTLSQCQATAPTAVATVTFAENFATAFKVRTGGLQNVPGVVYFSESGLEINVSGGTAGTADTGTRLQTIISNIPPGVSIWVDNWASSPAAVPGYPSDATFVTGPGTPIDPGFNTVTQISNGTESVLFVLWEVTNTNPDAIDSLSFNIYASFNAGAATPSVTATALSGFGPQFPSYASGGPIPEFSSTVETVTSPVNLFTISPCQPITPAPGTVLSENLADFSWNPVSGATEYQLSVGTSPGSTNVFFGTSAGTSQSVGSIPCTDAGATIYVELAAEVNGSLQPAMDYTYQCTLGFEDFNHDGHPDIIWQDMTSGLAQIWYFGGSQGVALTGAANLTLANPWRIVAVADFNGDGNPDVVWQDPVSGEVQVWYMGGPGGNQITGAINIAGPNPWRVAAVVDFNGDGHADLLWQDQTSGLAQIWYMGGPQGNTFLSAVNLTLSNPWRMVGTADFNGDGHPDILWQDPVSGMTQVWYMGGSQGNEFLSAASLAGPNAWQVVAIADFNLDGHPDLVWEDPVSGSSQVWFMTGAQGTTVQGTASLSGANPWRIAGPR